MASTVRLYVDAAYAIAIMALVGIICGFRNRRDHERHRA